MIKPLFASLFAVALTIPGCGKETPTPLPAPAPRGVEVTGIDLDGQPMKLSDYRGKVVALSFWGEWCHVCVKLFPHEKTLVEKYLDHPFVLLGANSDPSMEVGRACEKRHQLSWRSFYVGDPDGPVPTKFGVKGWPTIFIFDANGDQRFRFEGPQAEAIDRAVETLLRQMAADRKA